MNPERVTEIYSSLEKLVIELDRDPASRGVKYLQDLISRTRGYLNETSNYLAETFRMRHRLEMELQAEEAAFEVRSDELLASDNRVSRLPNIDDRKAMINVLLGDDRRHIQDLKHQLKNLGHVEKVIRHRHKELENTMSAIRLQRSLIETEVRTGSYYGDEGETSRGQRGGPSSQDFDDEEILRLLSEVETEAGASKSEPEATALSTPSHFVEETVVESKEPPALDDSKAISRFLDGDDDDFEGIFAGM